MSGTRTRAPIEKRATWLPPWHAVWGILRADALRVTRDRFMLGMILYVLAVSVAMRWIIPGATAELAARIEFDLVPYHGLIMSHVIVQLGPLIGGMVGGFLILESKENRALHAFRVTPVSVSAYVFVLGTVLILGSVLLTVVEGLIVGTGTPSLAPLVLSVLAASPSAVGIALAIGTFASTKTQAFAYLKVIGMGPLLPTASYFLPEPLQYVVAIYPPYWGSKAYWMALDGDPLWPLVALGGLIVSSLALLAMTKLFTRSVAR